jgi:hypothetical protein
MLKAADRTNFDFAARKKAIAELVSVTRDQIHFSEMRILSNVNIYSCPPDTLITIALYPADLTAFAAGLELKFILDKIFAG